MKDLKEFVKQIIKGEDSPAVKYYYLVLFSMINLLGIIISTFIIIGIVNMIINDPLSKVVVIIAALLIVIPLEIGYILFKSDKYDF